MPITTAAALIGSAVIGAGASAIAGGAAAGAQRDAAAQQAATQRDQIAENRRQYDQSRADLAPYRSVGTGALYKLSNLMGVSPVGDGSAGSAMASGRDYNTYLQQNPDVMQAWQALPPAEKAKFPTPQDYAQYHYNTYGQAESRNAPANPADFGALDRSFTLADFNKDPGYQFRMDEGQRGLEASAAARGGVLSGGALKALERYRQGEASQEYGKAYDRFNNDLTGRYNRLAGLAGTGQQATNSGIQAGQDMTRANGQARNGIADAYGSAGNATASMYAGVGNTIANTANNIGGYFAMKSLYGGGGGGSSPYYNPGAYGSRTSVPDSWVRTQVPTYSGEINL